MDIGIIGPGNMGLMFARFFIKNGHRVLLQGRDFEKTQVIAREIGAEATKLIEAVDVLVIAVKPKDVSEVQFGKAGLILSLLGKVTCEDLAKLYPDDQIIRVCPNVPCAYESGILVLVDGPDLSESARETAHQLLRGMGLLLTVPETLMDPLFVYAGSGPGFFALFLEAYIDAGVRIGLKSEQARELALRVMQGTALCLENEKVFPEVLRRQVSSPGGCTIRGVEAMEEGGLRSAVIEGIARATASLSE